MFCAGQVVWYSTIYNCESGRFVVLNKYIMDQLMYLDVFRRRKHFDFAWNPVVSDFCILCVPETCTMCKKAPLSGRDM